MAKVKELLIEIIVIEFSELFIKLLKVVLLFE